MDTFGHGLWVAAIFWIINMLKATKKKFKFGRQLLGVSFQIFFLLQLDSLRLLLD